jgi:hypothetical protein
MSLAQLVRKNGSDGEKRLDRTPLHVDIGMIGHIDHDKTTLAAAIKKVLAKHDPKVSFRSFTPEFAVESVIDISLLGTSGGATRVEDVLGRMEHGVW